MWAAPPGAARFLSDQLSITGNRSLAIGLNPLHIVPHLRDAAGGSLEAALAVIGVRLTGAKVYPRTHRSRQAKATGDFLGAQARYTASVSRFFAKGTGFPSPAIMAVRRIPTRSGDHFNCCCDPLPCLRVVSNMRPYFVPASVIV